MEYGRWSEHQLVKHWVERTGAKDNTAADATHAAGSVGTQHAVTYIFAGFDANVTKILTLKEGSTAKAEWVVVQHREIDRNGAPIYVAGDSTAVTASLAASGAAGTNGYTTMAGFTFGHNA